MSRLGGNFAKKIFSGPAYDRYTSDLSRAELAPTTFDYNLAANEAAGNFIQDRIGETFGNNRISRGLGEIATYAAVPGAFLASPFHEAAQVIAEDKLKDYALPYSGDFANFTKAMLDQRVPQTMIERAGGVLQSTNLGKGIFDLAGKTQDIVSGIRQKNPGVTGTDYFGDVNISQPPGTDVGIMSNLSNLFGSSAMADEVDKSVVNVDSVKSAINAARNREALNRIGSLALDDAGLNTAPFNVNEVSTDGITNNVKFRDMLLNDIRNLPSDIRTSLGTTKDALTKDVSGLKNFLTNIKDKGIDLFGSGKELALRGIGNLIAGPIGGFIGSLIAGIKESPTDKVGLASFGGDYDPYGFKGQLTSGTLGTRQDPFGRNIVSAFGDYYGNRLAEVAKLSKLQNLNKFQKAKLDFGKKYLEKVKEERAKKEAAQRAAVDRMFQQGQGGSGQDFTGGRFDRARSRAEYDRDPTGFSGSF